MNPMCFFAVADALSLPSDNITYSVYDLFQKGGWIMWPLLVLSVICVVVLLMCCFSTRSKAVLSDRVMEQAETLIKKRDYNGLFNLCRDGKSCYERVMLSIAGFLMKNSQASNSEIQEIASAEGGRQIGFLSRQVSWLSDIGNIAPMLGLLGTVIGMMKTFFEMSNGNVTGSAQRIGMSAGVAESLITTAGGLLLGIPALLAYAYFRSRLQKRVGDLETAVTHSVAVVSSQLQEPSRLHSTGRFHERRLPDFPVDESSRRDVRGS